MYNSGYTGVAIPQGYVTLKNCSTVIVYLSIINCLSKFDYNCPVFLTILFMFLYLSNSINQHETKIFLYIFYLTTVTIILDVIWFLYNYNIKRKVYEENEINIDNHLELEFWNHQHGLHLMELILTPIIWIFKIPLVYQLWQMGG